MAMVTRWKAALSVVVILAVAGGFTTLMSLRKRHDRPIVIVGAVIKQDADPRNQSPIAGVQVTAADGLAASGATSDFTGSFHLTLRPGVAPGQPITLIFNHPDYRPVDLQATVSDTLYVARMVPLHSEIEAELNNTAIVIENVLVRYSTEMISTENIGNAIKTFQVPNTGTVPCNKQPPCSPDGKWKAQVGSADLDAGEGNVFQNARVTCIAGPCPFTRVDYDDFSRGGRKIKVTMRDWSDAATFLLQAEVFRSELGATIRQSHPVIFGRALNFTLPGTAEGPTIEAELNGSPFVFPLSPNPVLSWANCNIRIEKQQAKDYRCELKAGYRFQ
jgi:hypothetical protein